MVVVLSMNLKYLSILLFLITMNKKTFTIWMAGFYEGEGYVSNDKSNNNRIRLGIDQNDPTPLIKAQKIWEGL